MLEKSGERRTTNFEVVICGLAGIGLCGIRLTINSLRNAAALGCYANSNRGTCAMQVWMAESREGAKAQNQE